jgi:hypothetical protein
VPYKRLKWFVVVMQKPWWWLKRRNAHRLWIIMTVTLWFSLMEQGLWFFKSWWSTGGFWKLQERRYFCWTGVSGNGPSFKPGVTKNGNKFIQDERT